jgi:hypothetical protein
MAELVMCLYLLNLIGEERGGEGRGGKGIRE